MLSKEATDFNTSPKRASLFIVCFSLQPLTSILFVCLLLVQARVVYFVKFAFIIVKNIHTLSLTQNHTSRSRQGSANIFWKGPGVSISVSATRWSLQQLLLSTVYEHSSEQAINPRARLRSNKAWLTEHSVGRAELSLLILGCWSVWRPGDRFNDYQALILCKPLVVSGSRHKYYNQIRCLEAQMYIPWLLLKLAQVNRIQLYSTAVCCAVMCSS